LYLEVEIVEVLGWRVGGAKIETLTTRTQVDEVIFYLISMRSSGQLYERYTSKTINFTNKLTKKNTLIYAIYQQIVH
jgi:hypothetical protein